MMLSPPSSSSAHWRSHYPFASQYVEVQGVRMHYVDEGQGRPVLMVHGNPTWSFYYRRVLAGLSADYRAIAIDHVGCGLSDKPQRYPYNLARRIDDLVRLIEHLDLRQLTLVVHDWGGAIGLGAALRVPQRIARLIILNTGAFPPPYVPLRIRMCRVPGLGTAAVRGLNAFARAALWMAVERPLDEVARQGLLAPYDSWAHRVAIDRFVKDIPFTRRHPTWQTLADLERGLPELATRPIQILWGMRDWCFTPVCLERLRGVFPQAEVHELASAGHYVLEDAGEYCVAKMRAFLARTDDQLTGEQPPSRQVP